MTDNAKRVAVYVAGTGSFGRSIAHGAMNYAKSQRPMFFHVELNMNHPDAIGAMISAIEHLKIDGVIAEGWVKSAVESLVSSGVPVVDVSGTWNIPGLPRVHADQVAVGKLAACHLLDNNLKSFAIVGPAVDSFTLRKQGFADELARHGHDCHVHQTKSVTRKYLMEVRREELANWIESLPKPVGIFSWDDMLAIDIVHACHERGIVIPDQVCLLGSGNDEMATNISWVPLSSVDLAPEKIGYEAAAMLDKLMHGEKPAKLEVFTQPVGVIRRASSDLLAVPNEHIATAMRYIQNNAHKPITVRDVLKGLPISRRTLESNFLRFYRRTPKEQIRHGHIELAKSLLLETDLDLAKVAERSGFSGPAPFSVIFKRLAGMTPRQFRQKFRVR